MDDRQQEQKPDIKPGSDRNTGPIKKKKIKPIYWVIIIVVVIVVVAVLVPDSEEETNTNKTPAAANTNTQATPAVSAEDEYKSSIATISEDVSEGLFYIADLSSMEPSPLFWTEDEIYGINTYTIIIEMGYDDASILDVPTKYQEFHDMFLQALQKYAEAMPLYREGIDELDEDLIDEAADILFEGNELLDQSTEILDQVN